MNTGEPEYREERTRPGFRLSPAWLAVGFSVLAVLYNAGTISGRISETQRRVEQLEAADRQRGDALSRIDARTARIEATLDIMRGGQSFRPLSEPLPITPAERPAP